MTILWLLDAAFKFGGGCFPFPTRNSSNIKAILVYKVTLSTVPVLYFAFTPSV